MTDTRPMPVDHATVQRYYYPAEPDSSVTRIRAAMSLIDSTVAAIRTELDEADERERGTIGDVFDAAMAGDDLTAILTEYRPGRVHAEQRLALLERTRSHALSQLSRAEHGDPVYTQWRQTCQRITAQWQEATWGETPEARFEAMMAFVANH